MYTVYHIPNVKFGCTEDLTRRSKENRHKYGKDIIVDIIEVFDSIDDADEFEEFCNDEAGYPSSRSYKHTVHMRKNMDNSGEKNGMYGYQYTEEQLRLKSEQGKGKIISDKHKKALSDCLQGNTRGNIKVDQYDCDNNFLETFPSLKIAAVSTGANAQTISKCLIGKNKTSGGYKWKPHK